MVTAVLPYFPYSRQSKKKSHRGAITARMLANLLHVAGVNHVITVDLHASQMQGFFRCPVDNLVAQPLISRWIQLNVPGWKSGVVVGKNPGATKRVTSLADALKLTFGIVMTDRYRPGSGNNSLQTSMILDNRLFEKENNDQKQNHSSSEAPSSTPRQPAHPSNLNASHRSGLNGLPQRSRPNGNPPTHGMDGISRVSTAPSGLRHEYQDSSDDEDPETVSFLIHVLSLFANAGRQPPREIIRGRLIHGHIVDDEVPSPSASTISAHGRGQASLDESIVEHMTSSVLSTASSVRTSTEGGLGGLGGSGDAVASSDEEEENLTNPGMESTVTFVGDVRDKVVFIVDDMIDKPASWIAAAETVVKRGGATQVHCMATHGLFGGDCLEQMEVCDCIEKVVVTNTFPIPPEKASQTTKLAVLDVSVLLSEAIRRNHHGESMSQLFLHYD